MIGIQEEDIRNWPESEKFRIIRTGFVDSLTYNMLLTDLYRPKLA